MKHQPSHKSVFFHFLSTATAADAAYVHSKVLFGHVQVLRTQTFEGIGNFVVTKVWFEWR